MMTMTAEPTIASTPPPHDNFPNWEMPSSWHFCARCHRRWGLPFRMRHITVCTASPTYGGEFVTFHLCPLCWAFYESHPE